MDNLVALGAGEAKRLDLAVRPTPPPEGQEPEQAEGPARKAKKSTTFWNNPLTVALIVVGSAAVIGTIVSDDNETDSVASQSQP